MWCEAPAIQIITTPRHGKRRVVHVQSAPAYQIVPRAILASTHELSYSKASTDPYSTFLRCRYTKPAGSLSARPIIYGWE